MIHSLHLCLHCVLDAILAEYNLETCLEFRNEQEGVVGTIYYYCYLFHLLS